MEQNEVKLEETTNSSFFVAGWRPVLGWLGVGTLTYSGLGVAIFSWIGALFGLPPLPTIDPATLNTILTATLGVGAARTIEKIKEVATVKVGN